LYLLLYIFWIILNGKLTLEVCLIGLAVTAALGLLMRVLFHYTPALDLRILKKVPLFIAYVFVLIKEIVKASAAMFPYIFHEKKTVEPVLVTFQPQLKTRLGRFILANSITLTPGTITVEADEAHFTVHCLNRRALDVSPESVFLRWIRRLEA
jgi:Multisubunit Na+/H+ antiporter, MnhE subunit